MTMHALKKAYRSAANNYPFVVPVYRSLFQREMTPPFRRRFATPMMHREIKRLVSGRKGGTFFEAGANDGILFSNTAYLERYMGWTGLLVEAVPHKFVECLRNRRGSTVEHGALVGPDFDEKFVEIHYSDLMSFAPKISKLDLPSHLGAEVTNFFGKELRLKGASFLAPSITIADLTRKHGIAQIDLMFLDLEGAEYDALKGFDFERCRVDHIIVEVRELQTMDHLLHNKGYQRVAQFDTLDYLYSIKS
jgi:FkbM family methyltransferase